MSLETANKKQLQAVAAWYGVGLETAKSNADKAAVLAEKGISIKAIENLDLDAAGKFFATDVSELEPLDALVALTTDGVDMRQYERFIQADHDEEVEKPTAITTADMEAAEENQADYWRKKYEALQAEQATVKAEVEENAVSPADGQVLIVMTRANPTFEVAGVRFTKKFPFALVDTDKANYICSKFSGFRPAIPSEVKEFYS